MGRLLFIFLVGLVSFCSFLPVGWTTETTFYTGTASKSHWFERYFTTNRAGDVTLRITWKPKPGVKYNMELRHLTVPGDLFSYDKWCNVWSDRTSIPPPPPGDWSCTIPNGPTGGQYYIQFRPYAGSGQSVDVLAEVTAETD